MARASLARALQHGSGTAVVWIERKRVLVGRDGLGHVFGRSMGFPLRLQLLPQSRWQSQPGEREQIAAPDDGDVGHGGAS